MIIQQTNWLTRARKAAGAKGPAQAELGEDLQQVAQVVDLDTPEFDFLGGELNFAVNFNITGVAAQQSQVSIFNPLATGRLLVVRRISYSVSVAGQVGEFATLSDNAATGTAMIPIDGRVTGALPPAPFVFPLSVAQTRAGALAALVTNAQWTTLQAQTTVQDEFPRWYMLPPGTGFVLATLQQNNALRGWIWYSERNLESGELGAGVT